MSTHNDDERLFGQLITLYESNQLPQAEEIGRDLLRRHPGEHPLHSIMGMVLARQGRIKEAAAAFERAVQLKPDAAEDYRNLALAYREMGDMERAIECFQQAVRLNPRFAEAYNNLGRLLHAQMRFDEAENAFRSVIRIVPGHFVAHNNLGNVLFDQGRRDEAAQCFRHAIGLRADYVPAHNNLGNVHRACGRFDQAIQCYRQVLAIKPDYVEACSNLGNALLDDGDVEEAIRQHEQAIALHPGYAEAYSNLGNAYRVQGRLDVAATYIEKALALKPDHAGAYSNLGVVLREQGRLNDALSLFRKAIELNAGLPEAHNGLGGIYYEQGQLDAARACIERALELKPDMGAAHWQLATLIRYTPGHPHLLQMQRLYEDANLPREQRMYLGFALGKAYEDIGQYAKAFAALQAGNALRRSSYSYSIEDDVALFAAIRREFTPELVRRLQVLGSDSDRPVFVVGMPRSGTTLVEQILSSHSAVHGAGELSFWNITAKQLYERSPDGGVSFSLSNLPEVVEKIAADYLGYLAGLNTDRQRVTDKMPLNFRWIGLIKAAFPNAKIINLQRDARDTCLSIYKTCFTYTGNQYAFDLKELGQYYNLYLQLMAHWHTVFENQIYDISYEALVGNQRAETEKLLAYCGLDWEDGCMNFHETRRTVSTASAAQVRKSMYSSSVQLWQRYEQELAPLLEILAEPQQS